jgi:Flp pilus assembly protein TadD
MNYERMSAHSVRGIKQVLALALVALVAASCGGHLSTKGRNLVREGDYAGAIEIYNQQVTKNPDKKESWRDLAYAYYKKGDFSSALQAVSKADPADPSAHICLGLIYEATGKSNQAINAFDEALK